MASFLQKVLFMVLLLFPALVFGEEKCSCDSTTDDHDSNEALKYKLGAIFAIFVGSAAGVSIPFLGRFVAALRPEKNLFFIVKSFAAGVILATGFIHVLPDAFEDLTCQCLAEKPWARFPFTGFVAMVAAIGTLMVDTLATSYFIEGKKEGVISVHSHGLDVHSAASTDEGCEVFRHRVISQVLELGIIVHSVIIGIALGASESPSTIRPLVAALTFHQLFEGIGLGGCIIQAKFKRRAVVVMAIFFSLTTSVGIIIGMGISDSYDERSPTAVAVQGVLNAASAGILIYMALVDLLAADFMSQRMLTNKKLQLAAHVSLLIGAGCMSLLAIWA